MTLREFFRAACDAGREHDPRGRRSPRQFEDSAVIQGPESTRLNRVAAGIDIDVAELLLIDRLRQRESVDAVVAHHPQGKAWAQFYRVMSLQEDLLVRERISRASARGFVRARMQEVGRKVSAGNHMRTADAAALLKIPLVCLHTPADNHVSAYLQALLRRRRPQTPQDIVNILLELPEYRFAAENGTPPQIVCGSPRRRAGKIMMEMTGGTEGSKETLKGLAAGGVRTLVSMHLSEEYFRAARDADLNVVVAGHISSDTLGLNLLFDEIERRCRERLDVVCCSGFRRVRR